MAHIRTHPGDTSKKLDQPSKTLLDRLDENEALATQMAWPKIAPILAQLDLHLTTFTKKAVIETIGDIVAGRLKLDPEIRPFVLDGFVDSGASKLPIRVSNSSYISTVQDVDDSANPDPLFYFTVGSEGNDCYSLRCRKVVDGDISEKRWGIDETQLTDLKKLLRELDPKLILPPANGH